MRHTLSPQLQLGEHDVSTIKFDAFSRDDIPCCMFAVSIKVSILGTTWKTLSHCLNRRHGPKRLTPVPHSYINREPVVYIRPGQTVMLTLLLDPRGSVHATSGILPRKRIELMREHVASALAAMSMTFRVGPVLTDPETIRMPLPSEIPGKWTWVNRSGPTVWQEGAVVTATDDAKFGDEAAMFTEGWLKLSEALDGKKSSK